MFLNAEELKRVEAETGLKANKLSGFLMPEDYHKADDPEFRAKVVDEVIAHIKGIAFGDYLEAGNVEKWMPTGWWKTGEDMSGIRYKVKWRTYLILSWLGSKMYRLEENYRWKKHYFLKKVSKSYREKKKRKW